MKKPLIIAAAIAATALLGACGGGSDDTSSPLGDNDYDEIDYDDFDLEDATMTDQEIELVLAYSDLDAAELCGPYDELSEYPRDLVVGMLASEVDSPNAMSDEEYIERVWEYCDENF